MEPSDGMCLLPQGRALVALLCGASDQRVWQAEILYKVKISTIVISDFGNPASLADGDKRLLEVGAECIPLWLSVLRECR